MGNQQPLYNPYIYPTGIQQGALSHSVQYGSPTAITAVPVPGYNVQQNNDCCGPNVPASLQASNCCGPSYGPGIANAGFYNQNNNDCCNWNNRVVNSGGVVTGPGYGITGFTEQQSLDQWCCGPAYYGTGGTVQQVIPPVVQTYSTQFGQVQTAVPVPPAQLLPQLIRTSYVASQLPIVDPVLSSVIETQAYQPVPSTIVEVNPFTTLPTRITSVIERLGSVNPLRGSIMNRLETPQYIPQKQAYYEGQWVNGYMQGFGRLFFDSGAYFEGQFVNGLAQTRHGLFIYPDGSYYIGGVDKNVANGQGEFNYRNGRLIYKGQFLNDQPDGRGTQLYSDGSRYEGEFRFGKKEGRGKFVWRDGTVYEGQFQNGFMQGEGVHNLSNGETYKGQFRKNKRHGRGTHVSALGTHTGGYKRDKKQGEGQFVWNDGKVFKGNFHNGKPDGQGSLLMLDGTTVYGIWINGVLDQNSLTSTNPFKGSQLNNPRSSIVSVGSVGSLQNAQFGSGIVRTSQIVAGPPRINLTGGMLAGGFVGTASPFVNQRGSIVSVIGPGGQFRGSSLQRGSSIPRGSNIIQGGSSVLIGTAGILPIARGSSVGVLRPPSTIPSVIGRRQTPFPPMPPVSITTPVQITGVTSIGRGSAVVLTPPIINPPIITPAPLIARGSQVILSQPGVTSVVPAGVPAQFSKIQSGSVVTGPIGLGVRPVGVPPPMVTPIVTPPIITPAVVPTTFVPPVVNTLPPLPGTVSYGLNPLTPRYVPGAVRLSSVSPARAVVGINRPITPGLLDPIPQTTIQQQVILR